VDIERRTSDGQVVRLAHVGPEGADQIQVLAGMQPAAIDQGCLTQGRATDYVGPRHSGLQVITDFDREAWFRSECVGYFPGLLLAPSPDSDCLQRPNLGVTQNDMRSQLAGSDHEQTARTRRGEILRRERR